MPSRIVREGINSSARINALSPNSEIFYRRLMNVADDYGRFHSSPATLRGYCWPTCPDKFTDSEVETMLLECCRGKDPLIIRYEFRGCFYLQIQNFGQQTRTKSKFPDPKESKLLINCNQVISDCEADAQPSRSRIRSRISESEAEPDLPDQFAEELETAWERHQNYHRSEPHDLAFRRIFGMNGGFDIEKFRARHAAYCEYWARKGWNAFGSLTFLGWIEAGMPWPPPEPVAGPSKKNDFVADVEEAMRKRIARGELPL